MSCAITRFGRSNGACTQRGNPAREGEDCSTDTTGFSVPSNAGVSPVRAPTAAHMVPPLRQGQGSGRCMCWPQAKRGCAVQHMRVSPQVPGGPRGPRTAPGSGVNSKKYISLIFHGSSGKQKICENRGIFFCLGGVGAPYRGGGALKRLGQSRAYRNGPKMQQRNSFGRQSAPRKGCGASGGSLKPQHRGVCFEVSHVCVWSLGKNGMIWPRSAQKGQTQQKTGQN